MGLKYLTNNNTAVSSVAVNMLVDEEIMANAILVYEDSMIKMAKISEGEQQWCLSQFDGGKLSFDVCDESSESQKFEFVLKDHKHGTYLVKQDGKCLTQSNTMSLDLCTITPGESAKQEFTPSLVSERVSYSLVNENTGDQNVTMSFKKNYNLRTLWIEDFIVRGKSSVTRLMPDFNSYGLAGETWINNSTYGSTDTVSLDDRAGDIVTLTMPLKGDITKKTTPANVPSFVALDGSDFRISDDQGDLATFGTQNVVKWSVPEGWILNIYPHANFQGKYAQLTSTGTLSGQTLPNRVGSIAIVQRGHSPIRMQGADDLAFMRIGELGAISSDGYPSFYQMDQEAIKHVGPMDAGKDTAIGSIRALSDSFDTEAMYNGFYIRKQKSSSSTPFIDRNVWEPLNVGSWLSDDTGFKGELYYLYKRSTNQSAIWRLKQNGEARTCFPESGDDSNWKLLGKVYGEMENHYGDDVEGVRLYVDKNYTGDELTLTDSIPDLCHMSNAISSYEMPSGWEVQFFTGKNFTGHKYTRSGRSTNLGGFDKKIQSIRVTRRP